MFTESFRMIRNDHSVIAILGDDIKASQFIHLNVSNRRGRAGASYKVWGSKASAVAKVSAYRQDEDWNFNWIWLKLESGKYHTVVDNRKLNRPGEGSKSFYR